MTSPGETVGRSGFHVPTSWPDIPKSWWDVIFDGRLWEIDLSKMPPVPTQRTATNYVRKYIIEKGVPTHWVSTRYNDKGTVIYVQSRGLRASGEKADRLPLDAAITAPALHLVPPKHLRVRDRRAANSPAAQRVARQIDFTPEAEALWAGFKAAQPLDPVPPSAFVHHTQLGWIADVCDCGTGNFRVHPGTCNAYPMLGFLAHQVTEQTVPPERWAMRYGEPW